MRWHDHWHHGIGPWGWLVAILLMAAFWTLVVWAVITLVRHDRGPRHEFAGGPPQPPVPARMTPEDILHDRLARGEIAPDEYEQRLQALRAHRTP